MEENSSKEMDPFMIAEKNYPRIKYDGCRGNRVTIYSDVPSLVMTTLKPQASTPTPKPLNP